MQFLFGDTPVLTLRQIDQMNAVAKGTAFRAFKRAEPTLEEGVDYFVLDIHAPGGEAAESLLQRLNAAGALYPSSRVAVLISEKAYARMQAIANLRSQ